MRGNPVENYGEGGKQWVGSARYSKGYDVAQEIKTQIEIGFSFICENIYDCDLLLVLLYQFDVGLNLLQDHWKGLDR